MKNTHVITVLYRHDDPTVVPTGYETKEAAASALRKLTESYMDRLTGRHVTKEEYDENCFTVRGITSGKIGKYFMNITDTYATIEGYCTLEVHKVELAEQRASMATPAIARGRKWSDVNWLIGSLAFILSEEADVCQRYKSGTETWTAIDCDKIINANRLVTLFQAILHPSAKQRASAIKELLETISEEDMLAVLGKAELVTESLQGYVATRVAADIADNNDGIDHLCDAYLNICMQPTGITDKRKIKGWVFEHDPANGIWVVTDAHDNEFATVRLPEDASDEELIRCVTEITKEDLGNNCP